MRTYFIFMHSPKKFAKAAMWHTGVEPADAVAANWVAAGDPAKQRARAKIAFFFILAFSFAGILYFVRALVPSGTTFGILSGVRDWRMRWQCGRWVSPGVSRSSSSIAH